MAYIKNRFSRLFGNLVAELSIIIGSIGIAINLKTEIPIWLAIGMIMAAVSTKIFIKNDLE